MLVAERLHVVVTGHGVRVLPQVKVELPVLGRRQRAVLHLHVEAQRRYRFAVGLHLYGAAICAPISRFAKETRDLALVMSKSVTCGEVEKAIAEASSFVESVELFDVYEGLQVGPEKKSMAFTVTFAPKDEEFTTEAVDGYVKKILKNLNNKLGVELRS